MQNFAGKVAVVTGAGSGIGRGLVQAFGRESMRVVAADVEKGALDETVERLRGDGVDVSGFVCDVSRYDDVGALADHAFGTYGAVDVLCNNAGVFAGGTLWERPASDYEWTDRKSTRLNSSHSSISYAVFCLKKKKKTTTNHTSAIPNRHAHEQCLSFVAHRCRGRPRR